MLTGTRSFMIRASQGLWLGKAWLVRLYYFVCLACFGHIGWLSRGSEPLGGKTLRFCSSHIVSPPLSFSPGL